MYEWEFGAGYMGAPQGQIPPAWLKSHQLGLNITSSLKNSENNHKAYSS